MVNRIINENKNISHSSDNNALKNKLITLDCIELLNFRAQEEEKSARLYEDMYMFLDNKGYTGAGALWHKYAHEELVHVDWARGYLLGLGIQPEVRQMPNIISNYSGLVDIIQRSYDHEVEITRQCKELAACAMKNADPMLYELALRFVKEQHEEITKMQTWLDKLEAFGVDATALRFLDNEMAQLAG
jgi:ferritin